MGVYKYTGKKGYYIDTLGEYFTGIISGLIPRKAGTDPGFHFHDLQQTFASHQKMAGTDDCTHMDIMGHSDHRMIRRYAHLTPEHKRKAINSLPVWHKSVTYLGDGDDCNCAISPQHLEIAGI
jgi:integrase